MTSNPLNLNKFTNLTKSTEIIEFNSINFFFMKIFKIQNKFFIFN